MLTNRCNLRCSYCVLENAPHQLKSELDINSKKELVTHLYNNFGCRRLTLSGGEVIIFGKHPPKEFIELLQHIRQFKSSNPCENLEIEMYTNGTHLTKSVAQEMQGVVDTVAVTIDSIDDNFLSKIGRNYGSNKTYFNRIIEVCSLLSSHNMEIKLHSVVWSENHLTLPDEALSILLSCEEFGINIACWKFFQYMSYDNLEKDTYHKINKEKYEAFKNNIKIKLKNIDVKMHFKDNQEMNDSLFNILSYGNAQFMQSGDTWTTSKRTDDLRKYKNIEELFLKHDIDKNRFYKFHEIIR